MSKKANIPKFWDWFRDEDGGRILRLEGPIDSESVWGDEVTPAQFRDELEAEEGDVTVWLNSPGGNVFAASEIYTMLRDYKGKVTVKIDAIAASAASVVAMAGSHVAMSPTAMLMIHDPSTLAYGNTADMEKAIAVLNEVKESILNAYCEKSGLSRTKVSNLMSNETWMNAKKAVELGFADEILFSEDKKQEDEAGKKSEEDPDKEPDEEEKKPDEKGGDGDDGDDEKKKPFQLKSAPASIFSTRQMELKILNCLGVDTSKPPKTEPEPTAQEPAATPAEPPVQTQPPAEPETPPADTTPVIGMDGKTPDGGMPYNILMKQLDCLK